MGAAGQEIIKTKDIQDLEKRRKEISKLFYTLSETGFLDDYCFLSCFFFSFVSGFLIIKECHNIVKHTEQYFGMVQACVLNYDYIKYT